MAGGKPPGITGLNNAPFDLNTLVLNQSPTPGLICLASEPPIDELTPIAQYMALEINVNTQGNSVASMRQFNNYSATECITAFQELPLWKQLLGFGITPDQCIDQQMSYHVAALLLWTTNVRQNGPWDHKPIIARRFNPRNPGGPQHYHLHRNTLYYYDVWSNIHYGYVGAAAGFSEAVLLDGAGLEQIGSTLLRGSLPSNDPTAQGLRAWDDRPDRIGVELGISLFRNFPNNITPGRLLHNVLTTNGIKTKPFTF